MNPGVRTILYAALGWAVCSAFYFLSLCAGMPLFMWGICCGGALAALHRLYKRGEESTYHITSKLAGKSLWALMALVAIWSIVAAVLIRRYGEYDAGSMWTYYARVLVHPRYWTHTMTPTGMGNPSHPLLLPSGIAALWRMTASYPSQWAPMLAAAAPTLAIPLVLFFQFYRRSLAVACILPTLFIGSLYFMNVGLDGLADVWVALFFLISIPPMLAWRRDGRTEWVVLWGGALGACAFCKNEGLMLAAVSLLFHAVLLLRKPRALAAAMLGAAPFVVCIVLHKYLAPQSPVTATWTDSAGALLTDSSRYITIATYLKENLEGQYAVMKAALVAYIVACLLRRAAPIRYFWVILAAIGGYAAVYLTLTDGGLEWNLQFSMPRVLFHVAPAAYLVVAEGMARLYGAEARLPATP